MAKLLIIALAVVTTACGRGRGQCEQCIYKDATFSVGAAQCMPSSSLAGAALSVYECRSTPSNEDTTIMVGEWRDTERPCKP